MNGIKKLVSFLMAVMLFMVSYMNVSAAGIEICYDGSTHLYTGEVYNLYVNNNKITAAMEPIIFNDHALVPVREVFEECGASVEYTTDTRRVDIAYKDTNISMQINNNCAYVNGKPTLIPDNVVPKLIYKPGGLTKTMVPVRFISESAGMDVAFNGDTGEIRITEPNYKPVATPKPTVAPTQAPLKINDIETEFISSTELEVRINCSGSPLKNVSHFELKSPARVVVDFKGMAYSGGDKTIKLDSSYIPSVRTGVDSERTRIVVDVGALDDYSVKITGDDVTIRVKANKSATPTAAPTAKPTAKPTANPSQRPAIGIVQANSTDAKKIIMLDAGHGGSDPGAIGELDGKKIYEKDLTLSITTKVKAILDSYGYKTALTRSNDTYKTLSERPAMANNKNCALFVSIHINSATNPDAVGTEVYYSEENNGYEYGISSQDFAKNVLNGMLKYMNSRNRGVMMANWAVIRRSEMPAVLAEVGFISNESELRKMCSDSYQDKVAKGIAEGIINTVRYTTVP